MKRLRMLAVALLFLSLAPPIAFASPPPREIAVARTRLQLSDVVPQIDASLASIDLGPAPAPGGTRVVTRDELRRAIEDAHEKAPASLPASVRVVRKMAKLAVADVERITRGAIDGALPRGAVLSAVRPTAAIEVPAGWDAVRASLPQRPHHAGVTKSTAMITFAAGADTLASVAVSIDLTLTPEAAAYDLAKGSAVLVIVRRGLVEIEAPALATADADVGSVFPAMLRASGRIVRAKLVEKDRAELVEGG